ncbi:MAG: hypothetical protein BWY09_02638 [Candidatus Hydrogenedentes bacterium ADurb.Bin179]|nr:MAG: hypothetical protein BWY09_02638 [Candidatus Hydrogenedentes bacterium ADurb.Bin179]
MLHDFRLDCRTVVAAARYRDFGDIQGKAQFGKPFIHIQQVSRPVYRIPWKMLVQLLPGKEMKLKADALDACAGGQKSLDLFQIGILFHRLVAGVHDLVDHEEGVVGKDLMRLFKGPGHIRLVR